MESLGQLLKREREARGISIEAVARFTKYHIENIKALEEDRYDVLPATPYIKGMLRSIAQCLRLNSVELILTYEASQKVEDSQHEPIKPPTEIKLSTLPFYQKKYFFMISAFTIFILLSSILYFIFKYSDSEKFIVDPNAMNVFVPLEPDEEVLIPTPPTEGHNLTLYATEKVWLKIQTDSDLPYDLVLSEGKSLDIKARKVIRFFVSDAAHVNIQFNHKEITSKAEGPQTFVFPESFSGTKDRSKIKKKKLEGEFGESVMKP